MALINFNAFYLIPYNKEDYDHVCFSQDMLSDPLVKKYLKGMKTQLNNTKQTRKIETEVPYLFLEDDRIIGYLYLFDNRMEDKSIDLTYAIGKEYRNQHYGTRLLKNSRHLLNTIDDVETIRLIINPSNKASCRAAIQAGFENNGGCAYYLSKKL